MSNYPEYTSTVWSSFGTLLINDVTGEVIECMKDDTSEPCYLDDIERIDVVEFQNWFKNRYGFPYPDNEYDICEFGYWNKSGEYVEHGTFRYDIRKSIEASGDLKVVNPDQR